MRWRVPLKSIARSNNPMVRSKIVIDHASPSMHKPPIRQILPTMFRHGLALVGPSIRLLATKPAWAADGPIAGIHATYSAMSEC